MVISVSEAKNLGGERSSQWRSRDTFAEEAEAVMVGEVSKLVVVKPQPPFSVPATIL